MERNQVRETLEKQLHLLSERSENLAADNISGLVAASAVMLRIADVLDRWDTVAFSHGDQAQGFRGAHLSGDQFSGSLGEWVELLTKNFPAIDGKGPESREKPSKS